jgi:hypothetical protein
MRCPYSLRFYFASGSCSNEEKSKELISGPVSGHCHLTPTLRQPDQTSVDDVKKHDLHAELLAAEADEHVRRSARPPNY